MSLFSLSFHDFCHAAVILLQRCGRLIKVSKPVKLSLRLVQVRSIDFECTSFLSDGWQSTTSATNWRQGLVLLLNFFKFLELFFFFVFESFLLNLSDSHFDFGVFLLVFCCKLFSNLDLFFLELVHTLDSCLLFFSRHLHCLGDHLFFFLSEFGRLLFVFLGFFDSTSNHLVFLHLLEFVCNFKRLFLLFVIWIVLLFV